MSIEIWKQAASLVLPVCLLLAPACGDDGNDEAGVDEGTETGDGDGDGDGLEIVGSYTDDFDGEHTITVDSWTMGGTGVFHIDTYDNDAEFLVAQNDAQNEYFPDLWSRMDWTWDGDALYFCQVAYDAATMEDAAAADGADRQDLEMGCGGFGWSSLTPK